MSGEVGRTWEEKREGKPWSEYTAWENIFLIKDIGDTEGWEAG